MFKWVFRDIQNCVLTLCCTLFFEIIFSRLKKKNCYGNNSFKYHLNYNSFSLEISAFIIWFSFFLFEFTVWLLDVSHWTKGVQIWTLCSSTKKIESQLKLLLTCSWYISVNIFIYIFALLIFEIEKWLIIVVWLWIWPSNIYIISFGLWKKKSRM